jgi:hypothetical protein
MALTERTKAAATAMREYVPEWIASVETSAAPSHGTDETDESPSGGFGSGVDPRSESITPQGAEALKRAIIEVVTVDPARFDRAEYDRLTARWDAYEAERARREKLVEPQYGQCHGTDEAAAGSNPIQPSHQDAS